MFLLVLLKALDVLLNAVSYEKFIWEKFILKCILQSMEHCFDFV
jgi:hypothetical protein